jgi:dihydroorotate dehydrogenase (NAD+) catalytic subunit
MVRCPRDGEQVGCDSRGGWLAGAGPTEVKEDPAQGVNEAQSLEGAKMPRLRVQLGRLSLKNPIVVASGTFGYAREMEGLVDLACLGGIIPKTVTRHPREGNPPPRTIETPSGMLNSIGLDNDGPDVFLQKHLPYLRGIGTAIVVNIAGHDYDAFVELAEIVGRQEGVAALELNISCPNVTGGVDFAIDPEMTRRVVRGCRDAGPLPVIAKLTPNVTDVVAIAQAAADAGADAVSLINTLTGLAIDWRRRRPVLGAVTGGLSGPAIKPVALRMVWQVASKVDVPVIGIGGISNLDDVMEFLVAGARAVQVGTANFFRPTVSQELVEGLPKLLEAEGIEDVNDVIGTLVTEPAAVPVSVE